MSARPAAGAVDGGLGTLVSGVFVLLWATGFVAARLAMPHVPPLGFLALRFAGTLAVLLPLILAWLLFGEPFGLTAAVGMACVAVGVALVVRS